MKKLMITLAVLVLTVSLGMTAFAAKGTRDCEPERHAKTEHCEENVKRMTEEHHETKVHHTDVPHIEAHKEETHHVEIPYTEIHHTESHNRKHHSNGHHE